MWAIVVLLHVIIKLNVNIVCFMLRPRSEIATHETSTSANTKASTSEHLIQ